MNTKQRFIRGTARPFARAFARHARSSAQVKRSGLTLLELVIATSMLAVVMTSLSLVLRTARSAWDATDGEYAAMHHATTLARHFVRESREARSVDQFATGGGSIRLEMSDGSLVQWSLAGATHGMDDVVLLENLTTGEAVPLARGIRGLSFTGFEANGSTIASNPQDIQLLQVQVTVDRPSGGQQTVDAQVWVRSW